jgi:response regulator RpfG family c-di-GMP phosphodiesterase
VTPRSILIIDDDEPTRAPLRQVLEEAGYMVLEAPVVRKDSAYAERRPLHSKLLSSPVNKPIAHLSRHIHAHDAHERASPNHGVPTADRAWPFLHREPRPDVAATTGGDTRGV